MKRVADMFPGQGSQSVGMGLDFYRTYPEVSTLFEQADKIFNKDLSHLIFEGPSEDLTETENAQPALLLLSTAINILLEKEGVKPVMAVGHSLGEYSALVAAGVMEIEDALPLVATRGKLMEQAFPKGQGSMAAVLGLDHTKIQAVLSKLSPHETVEIANLNCPGQI